MKVFDHTVREIKREVNLKVLKVPEIEQKVLDATSDEPWGPHGSDLADIARATNKFGECEIIMKVLLQRLGATDVDWRHLYKTLAVIEYLLANGTQRSVGEIIDNSSGIAELTRFKFVEPNGKDVGLNVRKKAETVLAIVDDRLKLQQVREKAAATRDKYLGLSSTGLTYKSSAAAFGNGSYSSGRPYGSTGGSRESASFKDSYTKTEWSKSPKDLVSRYSSTTQRSKETTNSANSYKSIKRGSKSSLSATSGVPSSQKGENEDDGYDFNPRGSSASDGLANVSSNHVDLFGPSLMGNLLDTAAEPQVDLFADADFQSVNTSLEVSTGSHAQDNIDLFAGRSSFGGSVTSEHNLSSPAHPLASSLNSFQPSFATSIPSDREFTARDTPSKPSERKPPTP